MTEIDQRAMDVGADVLKADQNPGPLDVVGLALAAATAAGVFDPAKEPAEEAVRHCVVLDRLTERIEKAVVSDADQAKPGSTVEYTDAFYDEDGRKIGTLRGHAVVLTMTPHLWQ